MPTPSEIPCATISAYRATIYRIGAGSDAICLRIGTHSKKLLRLYAASGHNCGLFISAFNPHSEVQSDEANEAAHARLGTELGAPTANVIEGIGVAPSAADEPWEEKSFFALGIALDAAREIGGRYRQNAIVWVGRDQVPQLHLLR